MPTVRLAPSPTGKLHLGTARTALFNFLFAKKEKGEFVLRIEDTDKTRSTKEFEKDIIENLKWLGLLWGGEPCRQMERLPIYQKYAKKLLSEGKAYKEKGAIKFKVKPQIIEFNDLIHGDVKFDTSLFDDFVIIKSDEVPIFHFAVVVDDADMKITHVIRGEDHLSNTPKQILLQKALGFETPQYAHLPLILNPDRTKMSKRFGDVDVASFRKKGYLKEALINYLSQLGWLPADKQIYSLEELIKLFDIKKLAKSPAVFERERLDWVNSQWIKRLSVADLQKRIVDLGYRKLEPKIIELIKPRMKLLSEVPFWTDFFFSAPKVDKKLLYNEIDRFKAKEILNITSQALGFLSWNSEKIKDKLRQEVEKNKSAFTFSEFLYPIRIAITGSKVSPPLFESMEILGRDECLARLKVVL